MPHRRRYTSAILVPNVPCGVENIPSNLLLKGISKFLMYRVELKSVLLIAAFKKTKVVPNVPCGVENSVFPLLRTGK